jgi:hypothetical protein
LSGIGRSFPLRRLSRFAQSEMGIEQRAMSGGNKGHSAGAMRVVRRHESAGPTLSAKRKPWNSAARPLPPFGAAVLDAVRNGRPLNTFIMAGPDAWNRHRGRLDRVVLPPDAAPDDFDWSIFCGLAPTVIADDADQGRVKRLIWLLLRAQAKTVCVVFDEGGVTHARHFHR